MNKPARRLLLAIVLVGCFCLPALADSVAYTDLGPGGSYDQVPGWRISGASNNQGYSYLSLAALFAASSGGTLSQIDLGLGNLSGTNSAMISIYSDVSNNLGLLLFSGKVSNQPNFGSATTTLSTLTAGSGVLVAGGNYFLVVVPGGADTNDAWNWNNIGVQGTTLADSGSGFGPPNPGFTLPAFDVRVNAADVPEPSTWLMIGAELLCLLGVAGWRFSRSQRASIPLR
jgi:hypothetical protein